MKFSELIQRVRDCGVLVGELCAGGGGPDPDIGGVCEDSRKVRPGDLFVARSGSKKSGAEFIEEALYKGAAAIVTAEAAPFSCAVPYARVADANLACALLAHEAAGNPTAGMKMIGITGTKGKTTVAYLLRSVLKAAGYTVGMIGTVEIDDGKTAVPADMTTPGSVELVELFSRMKANDVTHCVMEVSSHALHQRRTAGIDFAVAIFTNLTGDHLDYHKTMEEYAAAKAMLFEGLKEGAVAVANMNDEWMGRMLQNCSAKKLSFGFRESPYASLAPDGWEMRVLHLSAEEMVLSVRKRLRAERLLVSPLVGKHNAYNLSATIAAADSLGLDEKMIVETLSKARGAPGRLQRVATGEVGFQVFVDYAHTHDALENVLTALRSTMTSDDPAKQSRDRKGATDLVTHTPQSLPHGRVSDSRSRLICLFGCGGDRDRTKRRKKMAAIAERLADLILVTSDNPRTEDPAAIIEEICTGFSPNWQAADKITVEPDRRAAIQKAIGMARAGDVVLLAGKGHENYQIIGTTKHHFDDVEEAENALRDLNLNHDDTMTRC